MKLTEKLAGCRMTRIEPEERHRSRPHQSVATIRLLLKTAILARSLEHRVRVDGIGRDWLRESDRAIEIAKRGPFVVHCLAGSAEQTSELRDQLRSRTRGKVGIRKLLDGAGRAGSSATTATRGKSLPSSSKQGKLPF